MEKQKEKVVEGEIIKEGKVISGKSSNAMNNEDIFAISALVIGIVNLCAWYVVCCGILFGVTGVILGALGMKSEKYKTLALVAIIINGAAILASAVVQLLRWL